MDGGSPSATGDPAAADPARVRADRPGEEPAGGGADRPGEEPAGVRADRPGEEPAGGRADRPGDEPAGGGGQRPVGVASSGAEADRFEDLGPSGAGVDPPAPWNRRRYSSARRTAPPCIRHFQN